MTDIFDVLTEFFDTVSIFVVGEKIPEGFKWEDLPVGVCLKENLHEVRYWMKSDPSTWRYWKDADIHTKDGPTDWFFENTQPQRFYVVKL